MLSLKKKNLQVSGWPFSKVNHCYWLQPVALSFLSDLINNHCPVTRFCGLRSSETEMEIQNLLLCLMAVLEFFMIASFALPDEDVYSTLSDPSVTFTYNRLSEVEKQCRSLLSSASELKTDEDTKFRLMGELSFRNGDWGQKTGGVPLMPFLDSGFPTSSTSLPTALNMVSFEVKDVSPVQHFQNTVSVGGYLVIGISRESSFVHGFNPAPNFIRPGTSALTFAFEGVYAENGGERSLCLLGKSTLTYGIGIYVPSNVSNGFGLETDQISLVLRYPMSFSLRNREIHGEMKSLNEKASPKYFDTVYISSQLGHQSMYQFSSVVQASTNCEPYLFYHDEVMEDGVQKFTWSEFCTILHQVSWEALSVFPDYKLGGSYLEDGKLASVLFGKDNEDVNLSYKHIKLILQHVQCSQATSNDSHGAEVSAVLRVIPAETDPNLARTMTGLSGLVFNAEGSWDPSSGKLCMLGCRTGDDSELKRCTLRISLYFPRALSIKQRSLVFGSISNIRDEVSSTYHLLFDLAMQPSYLKYPLYSYNTRYLSYNYSKLSLATSFKKRTQRFSTLSHIMLRYPALKGAESRAQLDSLSDDLFIDGCISPDGLGTSISISMEVLSLCPLIRHFPEDGSKKVAVNTTANVTFTNRQLLNVSTHLIFRELKEATQEFTMISYRNISQVFLEGIYDPVIGEMHLIGCRTVVIGGTGIERGLDCLIEVEIQYPSENMELTKITITSQRGQDDPLYFDHVSLLTNKTPYQDHSLNQMSQDDPLYFGPVSLPRYQNHTLTVAYRRTFEGILRILLLSGVIAITWIQLHYMKKQANVIPYVSIVMLALQFLGYSLPLLCGAEILFVSSTYDLDWRGLLPKVLDYAGKFLVLVYLVLTSRIFLTVYKYQNESLRTSKMKHLWVPHNKLVLLSTLAVHTGVLIWLSVYEHHDMLFHPENGSYKTGAIHVQQIWMSILKDLAGVVQDFFLLPQIISNFLLQSNVKSLQKAHYMGLTLIRLVLHLYEYISNPFLDSKFQDSKFVNPESTSEFRKSAVVIIMAVLAVIVHIQQNWLKLSQWLEL
ncbi:hypothetical protein SADUNF_Sadunf06G0145800 [Salix dunnii]|uniref:RING-type E3 ubiquitin transferase n=1 Tax=Salix dunnii TaxID=1413687 RepID=A0A835K065_9ROSI|nr:hypothetical protein SADUNF_Sadunf06G0145800 [Salix dunnii]